jgi:two-component system response regulator MprA
VIVEDDVELQALLERGLAEEGFRAQAVSTGGDLLEQVDQLEPDALVVDIGLPDADGRDVCQALRSRPDSNNDRSGGSDQCPSISIRH